MVSSPLIRPAISWGSHVALGGVNVPLRFPWKNPRLPANDQVVRFKEEPSTEFNAFLWCFFSGRISTYVNLCVYKYICIYIYYLIQHTHIYSNFSKAQLDHQPLSIVDHWKTSRQLTAVRQNLWTPQWKPGRTWLAGIISRPGETLTKAFRLVVIWGGFAGWTLIWAEVQ